jgi:flagellar biosynthesis/type III secretory pathway protein FliH
MQKMQLESFDDDAPHAAPPPEGYEQGFAAGYAEAFAAAKAEQATLQQDLVQSIADLEFKYQEVRGEITRSLGPLFATLCEKLFPQLVEHGFASQIAHILTQAAAKNPESQFNLTVHPDQRDAVALALEATPVNVTLTTDPELRSNAAWVRYAQGALHVDLDQMLDDIRLILSAVDFIETRTETHG